MISISPEGLAELAALLKERVGLHIRPDGYGALRLAVSARLASAISPDAASYLELLRSPVGDEEMRRLLPLVTVGKTSFFRDDRQFAALAALLPELLAARRTGKRPLAIWSAGCATGEEPYSLAMATADAGAAPEEVELLGTDVNPDAVAATSAGLFQQRRLRDLPGPLLERWFRPEEKGARATPELRRRLTAVRPHNLAAPVYPRPAAGLWDLILCRNVIIYFDTHTARQVLSRLHAVLAPGGYLFLGYSESLFRLFDGFELTEIAGAFVYRKPELSRRSPAPAPAPAGPSTHRYAMAPVRHVHPPPQKKLPPAPPPPEPPSPQEILDLAVALVEEGRFVAALDRLERLVAGGGESLAARLTLANLYGILRQPEQATESYLAALRLEPLHAETHLFHGIHLLTNQQKPEEAAAELARALFLDPDLALAHYYLGRCREKQRDPARARLSYRNAIDAYKREPLGRRQSFLGYYPDLPEDGSAFARAAEYALAAL